jgi:hypothetical protein
VAESSNAPTTLSFLCIDAKKIANVKLPE